MKAWIISSLSIIFCLIIGFISSMFQTESMISWYPTLEKSVLTPPGFVFPIVWTLLYICIGISLAYILLQEPEKKFVLVFLWSSQILFNFLWSILFFYMKSPLLGFIDIILLDIVVILFIICSFKSSKVSSLLFIPYLVWLVLATYLNGYVMFNN
ncbi:TspO/MBR family protein [Phocaeicola paurosaccharolyticus]|uniref:TspO/MBR family protein n=1 Tax=Phocaeicola paurosaccharolyticus TaxID=732242 RepID=UPI002FE2D7E0